MVIGTCTTELHIPGNGSLKGICPLKPFKRGAVGAGANHWSQACDGWGVRIRNGGEKRWVHS